MFKDLISYQLAENISEERLLEVADRIVTTWMKGLPGFISWEIHNLNDKEYLDIVSWESVEDAKAAEEAMREIPDAMEWYSCYDPSSIKGQKLHLLQRF